MHVFCDHCRAEFDAPYWRFGSVYPCPVCSTDVFLDRTHVRRYEASGYAVTFADFIQLVTDPAYSAVMLPLIRLWLGLERECPPEGKNLGDVAFRDPNGSRHNPLIVHERIQSEPSWQRQFYNNAMTLWHG